MVDITLIPPPPDPRSQFSDISWQQWFQLLRAGVNAKYNVASSSISSINASIVSFGQRIDTLTNSVAATNATVVQLTNTVTAQGIQITSIATSLTTLQNSLGTMAYQNADAVAIIGGTINGTVIGGVTPAAGTFTDLSSTNTYLVTWVLTEDRNTMVTQNFNRIITE